MNRIKIWFEIVKNSLSFKSVLKLTLEFLIYFLIFYLLTKFNVVLAILLILLIVLIKQSIKLIVNYREIINSNCYDFFLLKPVEPIVAIIIAKRDLQDIFVLLPIILYLKIKSRLK